MINERTSRGVAPTAERCRALAEAAGIERVLNAYLREAEIFHPVLEPDHPALKLLPPAVLDEIRQQGSPMRLELAMTDAVILGAVSSLSPIGHHRYGSSFWLQTGGLDETGASDFRRLDTCGELAELLLNEIAAKHSKSDSEKNRVRVMLAQIENSIQKTAQYVEHSLQRKRSLWTLTGQERGLAAEQSLLYGHPFHPTPKSSEGFSPGDLVRYAPEMGAAFALHYFAVEPELADEEFLGATDEELFPRQVIEAARQHLSPDCQQYRLLPCHPWQAEHLKGWPEVQQLLNTGKLVYLGEIGDQVYPTSSVRTVCDPGHEYIFKLPLNVRITNFIRVNPPEQFKRAIDASRVLAGLKDAIPNTVFTVLLEAGYRTIAAEGLPEDQKQKLAESFAVIFRENPVCRLIGSNTPEGKDTPTVVAALLEQPPYATEPPLWEAVRMAAVAEKALPDFAFVNKWLRRYLEISLLPILRLFLEYGVSLEAHVQNSMVTLQNGWPAHFYVRDLEGVSISRERSRKQNLFGGKLAEDSPVLYTDREAWHRLKYYVFVNHLGHLLHTLAYYAKLDEVALWQTVGEVLEASGLFDEAERKPYLRDLTESDGWPAKANFISCFQRRGETPLYVKIPNPLAKCGVKL